VWSLKTKWGVIKHDVNKFVGAFGSVEALCDIGMSVKDNLHKALELYKIKHL